MLGNEFKSQIETNNRSKQLLSIYAKSTLLAWMMEPFRHCWFATSSFDRCAGLNFLAASILMTVAGLLSAGVLRAAAPDRSQTFGGTHGASFDDSHDINAWGRITKIVIRHSTGVDSIGTNYISVSGTIGQPDAGGPMTGGTYSLTGGFWALISVLQTPGAPTLCVSHSGNTVTVYWQAVAGWNLQQNANLANTLGWSTSSGVTTNNGTNSLTINNPSGNLFFRLQHQ